MTKSSSDVVEPKDATSLEASQSPARGAKNSTWQAKGIMYVSKPRGAKDDIVRTANSKEEAQKLAKTSALIVASKSQFLPRSGVSVRGRFHVIFAMEGNDLSISAQWASETEGLTLKFSFQDGGDISVEAYATQYGKEIKPKKRAEYVAMLGQAINSLALLKITDPLFIRNKAFLEQAYSQLLDIARKALDEAQRPHEEAAAKRAILQKALNQLPRGSFIVTPTGMNREVALVAVHDGLEPLKPYQLVYALTPKHSPVLAKALGGYGAHAQVAAMRLLAKVPDDHPAALPAEIEKAFTKFETEGNVLARLETLKEMAEEEVIDQVFFVEPEMIDTYSSYELPYCYEYGKCWNAQLESHPLALTIHRSSLPQRPSADLITLDGILCVSDKAKAVLEEFNLGATKIHKINETVDYWALEICENKVGPIPDEDLYDIDKNGKRRLREVGGRSYYGEAVTYLAKRARFGPDVLNGADVALCDDLALSSGHAPAIVISKELITALKKAKCKWYKPVRAVAVIDV